MIPIVQVVQAGSKLASDHGGVIIMQAGTQDLQVKLGFSIPDAQQTIEDLERALRMFRRSLTGFTEDHEEV